MDSVFRLGNGDRVSYLHRLMHSFAASYVCLWSYSPDLNFLYCEDGHFVEEASSSTRGVSIPRRLFDEYKLSVFPVGNDLVPGLAFRDRNPCLEVQELDLQRLATIESQRHFYQEAKIKTAVFLGCEQGEIELGMSNIQQNLEKKMQNLFPWMDFPRLTIDQQQSKPSPSSSLSMDSPEYTSLFYNFSGSGSSSFHLQQPEHPAAIRETQSIPIVVTLTSTTNATFRETQSIPAAIRETQSIPAAVTMATSTTNDAIRETQSIPVTIGETQSALAAIRETQSIPAATTATTGVSHLHHHPLLQNFPFPTIETTDAALTKAYLAILSSPSTSSTGGETSSCPYGYQVRRKASAFGSFHPHSGSGSGPSSSQLKRFDFRRQTLLKRALAFYREINFRRIQELSLQGPSRPSSNQLHHMISERKRREKINESFQALRSLLPQGTKKDKASVLRTTKEYLSSLKDQVSELNKRNHQLMEAQLATRRQATTSTSTGVDDISTNNERLSVKVTPAVSSEPTSSGARMLDLQIILRTETQVPNLVIRILEFLKQVKEASIVSMEAQSTHQGQVPTNWVTFRLKIEGNKWDESSFIESIRRLLADS